MRILATGVKGEIAKALVRRLRDAGFVVDLAERGDDLASLANDADAVVVLEGTLPEGTDYPMALRAAANAVDRVGVDRLVAVTLFPYTDRQRKGPFKAARRAESALVGAGYPLEVIRAGLLVGSPDLTAPSDAALFTSGSSIQYPGDGNQRFRPLLLEDLCLVLQAALGRPARSAASKASAQSSPSLGAPRGVDDEIVGDDPWAVLAEGPHEFTVREFLAKLNPSATVSPPKPQKAFLLRLIPVTVVVGGFLIYTGVDLAIVATVPVFLGLYMLLLTSVMTAFTPAALPNEHFRLRQDAPTTLLDVRLRDVSDVWDEAALARRGPRRELDRGAKRYGATAGSYWVAGFVLAFAAGAGAVGLHDLFLAAPSIGARLAALALTVVAGITAFGGMVLLTRWPSRYAVAFVASIVCIATLIIVPAAALAGGDPSGWVIVGAFYFVPAAGFCCVHLWKRGGLQVKNVLATRGERVFGSVVVGGSLATVAQLLYGSVYLPATAKPAVSGEVQLSVVASTPPQQGDRGDAPMLTATAKLRNEADRPLIVLGAFYVVDTQATAAAAATTTSRKEPTGDEPLMARASRRSELVERDSLLPSGSRLEPGEQVTKRLVLPAREGSPVAAMRVDLAVTRPRYRHNENWAVHPRANGVIHYVAKVEDHTWFHDVTRSTRYIHLVHATQGTLGCADRRQLAAYVDGEAKTSSARWCGRRTPLDEHYGIGTEQFSAETSLR